MNSELQKAYREFTCTSDPQARARWLSVRVRHGELDPKLLEFASFLGDDDAHMVLGSSTDQCLLSSPYTCSRVAPKLLVGFKLEFAEFLSQLSFRMLSEGWTKVSRALSIAGLKVGGLRIGGIASHLLPDPGLTESPLDGFGWVSRHSVAPDAASRLNDALDQIDNGPPLFASIGDRRAYCSKRPHTPQQAMLSVFEWVLDEPGDWFNIDRKTLGERVVKSAWATLLVDLSDEVGSHVSPYAGAATRPWNQAIISRLLAWATEDS